MAESTPGSPRDRFDDVPATLARVGAHRAPTRSRALATAGWAALATGVLVGAGVLGLQVIESGVAQPEVTTSPAASASGPAPTVDPDASVVVLNATSTSGLAATAAKTAGSAGWDVTSTANADTAGRKESTVFYAEASQLGAARGLAKSLGITSAPQRSDRFVVKGQSRLTVVLGSDWNAPG